METKTAKGSYTCSVHWVIKQNMMEVRKELMGREILIRVGVDVRGSEREKRQNGLSVCVQLAKTVALVFY